MSVGYLLAKYRGQDVTAFTLKVQDTDKDIVKSREIAQRYGIDLVEIGLTKDKDHVRINLERYSPERKPI